MAVAPLLVLAGLAWLTLGVWQTKKSLDIVDYSRASGTITETWTFETRRGPSKDMVDVRFTDSVGDVHEFSAEEPRPGPVPAVGDEVTVLYHPRDGDPASTALIRAPEGMFVQYVAGPAVFLFGIVWLGVVWLWVRHGWSAPKAQQVAELAPSELPGAGPWASRPENPLRVGVDDETRRRT